MEPGGDICSRSRGNSSKKSARETCLGTTTRVSISEPGADVSGGHAEDGYRLTRTKYAKAIAAKGKDFAPSFTDNGLGQALSSPNLLDEFDGDLL